MFFAEKLWNFRNNEDSSCFIVLVPLDERILANPFYLRVTVERENFTERLEHMCCLVIVIFPRYFFKEIDMNIFCFHILYHKIFCIVSHFQWSCQRSIHHQKLCVGRILQYIQSSIFFVQTKPNILYHSRVFQSTIFYFVFILYPILLEPKHIFWNDNFWSPPVGYS